MTVDNKLGCDIYLKKVEQISDNVILLPHDHEAPLLIPPPRFSDRLNVVTKSRETRFYVAVQIFESKVFYIYIFNLNVGIHNFENMSMLLFHFVAGPTNSR